MQKAKTELARSNSDKRQCSCGVQQSLRERAIGTWSAARCHLEPGWCSDTSGTAVVVAGHHLRSCCGDVQVGMEERKLTSLRLRLRPGVDMSGSGAAPGRRWVLVALQPTPFQPLVFAPQQRLPESRHQRPRRDRRAANAIQELEPSVGENQASALDSSHAQGPFNTDPTPFQPQRDRRAAPVTCGLFRYLAWQPAPAPISSKLPVAVCLPIVFPTHLPPAPLQILFAIA